MVQIHISLLEQDFQSAVGRTSDHRDQRIQVTLLDKPQRNPEVEFRRSDVSGSVETVLLKRDSGESYSIGEDEAFIWDKLDGSTSLSELANELIGARKDIDEQSILEYVQQLLDAGLANFPGEAAKLPPKKTGDWFFELFSVDADRIASALAFPFKKIRPSFFLVTSIIFVSLVTSIFFGELCRLVLSSSTYMVYGSSILGLFVYLYVVTLPTAAIHEISHAIASKTCSISPSKLGFGILYLNPVFFTRIDGLIFGSRRDRIFIAAAGPWANVFLGSLTFLISIFVGSGPMNLLVMFSFLNLANGIMNLSPFFRSDGYYILSDVLRAPNLGPDAWTFFKNKLLRRPVRNSELSTSKKVLAIYVFFGISLTSLTVLMYTTWIYAILFGSDGLLQVILNRGNITLATIFGFLYFSLILGIMILQLVRRSNLRKVIRKGIS